MKFPYWIAAILAAAATTAQADSLANFSETLEIFDRAHKQRMKTDPGYRHEIKGDALVKEKQFQSAVQEYEQAARHAPKDALLHAKLGQALVLCKRPHEGLGPLNKSIVLSAGQGHWLYWAYLYKGTAHGMLGEMESAISALTKSITRKPTVLAHVSRASVYGQIGDLDAALRDYDAALELKPADKLLWTFKAQIHLMASAKTPRTGQKAKACHAMRKACDLGECRPLDEFTECKAD